MSSANDKVLSSLVKRNSSHASDPGVFAEKVLQLQTAILPALSEEQQLTMNGLLEELTDIYLADLTREKLKAEKGQGHPSENKLNSPGEGGKDSRKSQKVLLEVREGRTLANDIPLVERRRSPEKREEQNQKFAKFMPKKVSQKEKVATFASKLKPKDTSC